MSAKCKFTDKQRIDAVEEYNANVVCDRASKEERWIVGADSEGSCGDWKPTLREAIDSFIDWNKICRPVRRKKGRKS